MERMINVEGLYSGYYKVSKIDLIKMVRACAPGDIGLKEAKDAIELYLVQDALPLAERDAIELVKSLVAKLDSGCKRALQIKLGLKLDNY